MLVDDKNAEAAIRHIESVDRPTVDLETTGFRAYPARGHRQDRICGVAVLAGDFRTGTPYYFPLAHSGGGNIRPEAADDLMRVLASRRAWRGHNVSSFDARFMSAAGCHPPSFNDTFPGSHIFNENERHGLKPLSEKYLGVGSAEQDRVLSEKLMQWGYAKNEMWRLPASDVAPYACDDVVLCDRLASFYEETMPGELLGIWREVDEFSSIIFSMMDLGIQVDVEHLLLLKGEAEARATELERLAPKNVDISSPKSIIYALGVPDSTEATLSRVDHPLARLVLEYRAWRKAIDSYYKPYLGFMDEGGVIRPQLNIAGTISGRISGQDPNLLAVPVWNERQRVKEVFVARPGFTLVEADYSQAEIRLAAHYTQEQAVLKCLFDGVDLHQMVADRLSQPRQRAKTLNFSIIYGVGAHSLAENLGIPRKEAQAILHKYHDEFPGYKRLLRKAEELAENRGYISLWTGRRRHFNDPSAESRKAFSNLIQGGVAEMMRRAMMRLHRELPEARQLLQVYDSLLFEVPEGKEVPFMTEIRRIMEEQPWCTAPIKADLKVGKSWGRMQKVQP